MGLVSLVTAAFAVAAGCLAVFNLWIYWLRPRETAHLWLGVSAMGVMGMTVAMASAYEATTLAEAQRAQLTALSSSLPIVVGFLRFTALFLGVRMSRLEWVSGSFTGAMVVIVNLDPSYFFSGEAVEGVAMFGRPYVRAAVAPTAALLMPGFMVMFIALVVVFGRERNRFEGANLILGTILFWSVCGASDVAWALRVHSLPFLMPFGFGAFSMVFTALLATRFVRSMTRVHASAQALRGLVDDKSEELREKDLQLVHGARMATVGALANSLAAEIRTPIEAVAESVTGLAESWKDPSQADVFEDELQATREQVDRIRAVVADLLRISRRGEQEADDVLVDLREVVAAIIPLVRPEARTRAKLVSELAPVPSIRGQNTLLAQVVLNLLVNALHRIPAGDCAGQRVTISTGCEDGSVWLTVADTGPPIPEAQLERLFDPFGDEQGGELGLAVTHEIVARHRGCIDVQTGPDGSVFVVEFPPDEEEV
jgi:signal transduction histidine kinase